MFKKIVVPLDGTPPAKRAIAPAKALADQAWSSSSYYRGTVCALRRSTNQAAAKLPYESSSGGPRDDPPFAAVAVERTGQPTRDPRELVVHDRRAQRAELIRRPESSDGSNRR